MTRSRRPIRRALALAAFGSAGLALALAGPAQANAPSGSINSPSEGAELTTTTPRIDGSFSMSNGGSVSDVQLSLDDTNGHLLQSTTKSSSGSSSVSFSWTVSPLRSNGTYGVTASASGTDPSPDFNGSESASVRRTFRVNVPPATPTGVNTAVDPGTRYVAVTWNANAEPDLLYYQVQRAIGGGSFSVLAQPTKNAYTDKTTSDAGGTYRYRIVAVRQSATPGRGISSSPSAASSADVPDAPPPPTSSTAPPAAEPTGSENGTGATTGSTSRTPSSSGSGTASPSSSAPTLARSGEGVDLSGFASLLNQARRTPSARAPELDPGYSETLPFQTPTTADDREPGQALAQPAVGHRPFGVGPDPKTSWRFLAAGLLVTVLLGHVLFIKSQVDAAGVLEAVDPEPAG